MQNNGRFLDTKIKLWTHSIRIYFDGCICRWSIPVNGMENKPTVFMRIKNINAWTPPPPQQKPQKTKTTTKTKNNNKRQKQDKTKQNKQTKTKNKQKNPRRFNYKPIFCQNTALPLNWMHLNIPSTECWTLCLAASSSSTAWVGNAYVMSLAPWAILSISGNDDTTSPRQTFKGMSSDCSTHSIIWYILFHREPVINRPQIDMHWISDWLTQWPTLICWWFCNSGANRHGIWGEMKKTYQVWSLENFTRLRQISPGN